MSFQRTVVAPLVTIALYGVRAKKTLKFDGSTLDESVMQLLESNDFTVKSQKLDLAFCMINYFAIDEGNFWPGWSGFNSVLQKDKMSSVSRVGYLPIVDASQREHSTLNEVLKSTIRIGGKTAFL